MARIYEQFGTKKQIVVTGKIERFIKAQERLQNELKISPEDWEKYVSPVIKLARETMK